MINAEIALFADWSELKKYVTSVRSTDAIDAGQLSLRLRRLLLDSSPLIHIVNRTKKRKLHFPYQPRIKENISDRVSVLGNVETNDVAKPINANSVTGHSLKSFLQQDILEIDGCKHTVRTVIKEVANRFGGVHFDFSSAQLEGGLDPAAPDVAQGYIGAICTIAKLVSIGIHDLANACSPLPPYDDCFGHFSSDPGVIDFDSNHLLEVIYEDQKYTIDALTVLAVLEMKPQQVDESVLFTMQSGPDQEAFKISFSYDGELILDLNWTDNQNRMILHDHGKVRPIGKKIFLAISIEPTDDGITISMQINANRKEQSVIGNFGKMIPYRSILAADSENKNGCGVRLFELMLISTADRQQIQGYQQYAYYRYSLDY
ncbi:hypothetical protein [Parasphingorhabdus cellanae]|uniref:Uncharacterized protein n=1 Tax=Parasphingorhabdus cellanae TaxID=2806553 RepID=A0ABX7T6H5_9SPHN|nr:hypothetical protein [Parasphingorhabdus cellanae]QTD57216.1 hypothetical protein J4G78_06640 [Parasphingorhabdus cellanae]